MNRATTSLTHIDAGYPVFALGGILVTDDSILEGIERSVATFKRDFFGTADIVLHTAAGKLLDKRVPIVETMCAMSFRQGAGGRMNATAERIAETFERHVASRGYDKANLDDVARELRISKKTIYVHFSGKRDIYAQVVARQARQMQAGFAAAVAPLPTWAARVEAAVRSLLEVARAHIVKTGEDEWLREYEIAADAFRKANGDLLRELVQGGMDAGEFRPGDATLIEKMIAAMLVEYLLLVNADPAYDRDAELLERIGRFVE